eukprot:Em0018g995a
MACRALLACGDAPYLIRQEYIVTDDDIASEPVCGWRCVRPSAHYVCNDSSRKQKAHQSSSLFQHYDQRPSDQQFAYMSGRVNDDFSYVYVSRPVECGVSANQQLWKQPNPSIVLEPVKPTRSTHESRALCRDFAKIVADQLHQDLLLEQAKIQNQLQATLSDRVIPLGLAGIGITTKPLFTRNLSNTLTSTLHCSSLPEPMHKAKVKTQKAQRPLGWFPFGRVRQVGTFEYPQNLLVVKSQHSMGNNGTFDTKRKDGKTKIERK